MSTEQPCPRCGCAPGFHTAACWFENVKPPKPNTH